MNEAHKNITSLYLYSVIHSDIMYYYKNKINMNSFPYGHILVNKKRDYVIELKLTNII